MSKNFSAPRSVANPASVRHTSPSFSAVMAPVTPSASAVTGLPSAVRATSMRPSRCLRSIRSSARQRAAMISDAEVIRNPPSRGTPSIRPPSPTMTLRSARSFTSRIRFHATWRTSMPSGLPWCTWLSSAAASRLWAEVIAWKSPVKCRLISSIGTTCDRPPPVPPPFMPSVGPIDGSRRAMTGRPPTRHSAWPSPMVMVVLPSPAGVGVIEETTTSLPSGRPARAASAATRTLALSWPYGIHSSAPRPSSRAISAIGRGLRSASGRDGVEVGIGHDLLQPVGNGNHLGGGRVPAGVERVTGGDQVPGLVVDLVGEAEAGAPALAHPRGDLEQLVETGRLDVLDESLHHRQVHALVHPRHGPAVFTQILHA